MNILLQIVELYFTRSTNGCLTKQSQSYFFIEAALISYSVIEFTHDWTLLMLYQTQQENVL